MITVALGCAGVAAGCGLMLDYADFETAAAVGGAGVTGGAAPTGGAGGTVPTGGTGPTGGTAPTGGGGSGGGATGGGGAQACGDEEGFLCVPIPAGWAGPLIGFTAEEPGECSGNWVDADIADAQQFHIEYGDCRCVCGEPLQISSQCTTKPAEIQVTAWTGSCASGTACTPPDIVLQINPGATCVVPPYADIACTPAVWQVDATERPPAQADCDGFAEVDPDNPHPAVEWFDLQGRACQAAEAPTAEGCQPNQRCVPERLAGSAYCIVKQWESGETLDDDCPAPYDTGSGTLLYNAPSPIASGGDLRTCVQGSPGCTCDQAQGECWNGKVTASTACVGGTNLRDFMLGTDQGCVGSGSIAFKYEATGVMFQANTAGACVPHGNAVGEGGVDFQNDPDLIVCCAAPGGS
jgi:hypothetical protein